MAKDKGGGKEPEKDEKKEKSIQKVRVLATDIDGSRTLLVGIARIKGVGHNLAKAILSKMDLDAGKKLVDLSDEEIDKIEKAIEDPSSLGVPAWMLNRRKDLDTGKDIHISTSDLTFKVKEDLDLMGEIKSYKGLRHAKGLKVRGQRTASTGRGTTAMGVKRKKT